MIRQFQFGAQAETPKRGYISTYWAPESWKPAGHLNYQVFLAITLENAALSPSVYTKHAKHLPNCQVKPPKHTIWKVISW